MITLFAIHDTEKWMSLGLCHKDNDPELWFPVRDSKDNREARENTLNRRNRAIGICRQCPVKDTCLEYALTHGNTFGIWGGLTEEQIKLVRKGLRP